MKLKSYFSGTVEAAMELARQELGENALLVNARPATPETRYLGAYEVVFGIPPKQIEAAVVRQPAPPLSMSAAASTTSAGPATNGSSAPPSGDRMAHLRMALEVAGLKRDFERMRSSLGEGRNQALLPAASSSAPETEAPAVPPCQADPTLGRPGAARAIVALVGPPGVGKTTTLIKLAARYGLAARKPVQIISADVFRIAAADQLRTLSAILGVGCDIAETAGGLAQLLEAHRTKDLILVDTPGLGRADMEDASDLAALIGSHAEIDTHLVLPAFMRSSDMDRVIEQYAVFGPRKVLFTCLDETGCHQDLVRVAASHSLPVSFLGTGQQIPDDLEPASDAKIAELAGSANTSSQTRGAAA